MFLDKVNNLISEIERLDKSKGYYYEQLLFKYSNLEHLPIMIYKLKANDIFYRSRVHGDRDPDFFQNISEISYPPEKYVYSYARVNKPCQSLFYCSDCRPTSYIELADYLTENKNDGDIINITIGCWQLVEDIEVILIYNPSVERNNAYSIRHGTGYDGFIEYVRKNNPPLVDGTRAFYEYLGAKFASSAKENSEIYKLTAAYANLCFSKELDYQRIDTNIRGIIYPSVPREGEGFNIAFYPEIINDNRLRLLDVKRDTFRLGTNADGTKTLTETGSTNGTIVHASKTINW